MGLAVAQGFSLVVTMTQVAYASLAAASIAGRADVATLPVALATVGTAVATVPASFAMHRLGRRPVFLLGALAGILGGVLTLIGVQRMSFALLAAGCFVQGLYFGVSQFHRYAAAEAVDPDNAPRAISGVLIGSLVAAFAAPTLVGWAEAWMAPITFAGASLVMTAAAALALLPLAVTPLAPCCAAHPAGPDDTAAPASPAPPRPWGSPGVLTGIVAATAAAGGMSLVMAATPLAMQGCGFTPGESTDVIQAHVLAMFGPALVVGELVRRFGLPRVMVAGVVAMLLAAIIALSGQTLGHFSAALILVGLGWNFLYVTGTTLITRGTTPATRARIQGTAEFIVFTGSSVAAILAGVLLGQVGWTGVQAGLILLLMTLCGVLFLWGRHALRATPAT
ncbi:MFS transporter [Parapedomonas caeni]